MFRSSGRHAAVASALALLVVAMLMWIAPQPVAADPSGYAFTPLALLGGPAPGGGNFTFDFEPYGINGRG